MHVSSADNKDNEILVVNCFIINLFKVLYPPQYQNFKET